MDPDPTIEPRSAQPDFIIKPFTTSMIIKAMAYCNRILGKFLKNSKIVKSNMITNLTKKVLNTWHIIKINCQKFTF